MYNNNTRDYLFYCVIREYYMMHIEFMCQWCHAQKVSLDRHLMADTLKSNT